MTSRQKRRHNEVLRAARRRSRSDAMAGLRRAVDSGALKPSEALDVKRYLDRGCSFVNALLLAARDWPDPMALGDTPKFNEHMAELHRTNPTTARQIDELAAEIHASWLAAE